MQTKDYDTEEETPEPLQVEEESLSEELVTPRLSSGYSPSVVMGGKKGRVNFNVPAKEDVNLPGKKYAFDTDDGGRWEYQLEKKNQGGRWEEADHALADYKRWASWDKTRRKESLNSMWGGAGDIPRMIDFAASQKLPFERLKKNLAKYDTHRQISIGTPDWEKDDKEVEQEAGEPRWSDISSEPDYKSLPWSNQIELKKKFFDKNIAQDPDYEQYDESEKQSLLKEFLDKDFTPAAAARDAALKSPPWWEVAKKYYGEGEGSKALQEIYSNPEFQKNDYELQSKALDERDKGSAAAYYSTAQYWAERIPLPGIGTAFEWKKLWEITNSKKRLDEGRGNDFDIDMIRRFIEEGEEDPGWFEWAADIATAIPALAVDFWATGGLFSAARAGATKMGSKLLKEGLEATLKKGIKGNIGKTLVARGIQGVGVGAGSLVQAAAMPHRIASSYQRERVNQVFDPNQDDNFGLALVKGLGDHFIEVFTEHSGGLFEKILPYAGAKIAKRIDEMTPRGRILALKKVVVGTWAKLHPESELDELLGIIRSRTAWNGPFSEFMEERLGEVMRGPDITGLSPDYGILGQVSSMPGTAMEGAGLAAQGEFAKAKEAMEPFKQVFAEMVAFSVVPGASAAMRRLSGPRIPKTEDGGPGPTDPPAVGDTIAIGKEGKYKEYKVVDFDKGLPRIEINGELMPVEAKFITTRRVGQSEEKRKPMQGDRITWKRRAGKLPQSLEARSEQKKIQEKGRGVLILSESEINDPEHTYLENINQESPKKASFKDMAEEGVVIISPLDSLEAIGQLERFGLNPSNEKYYQVIAKQQIGDIYPGDVNTQDKMDDLGNRGAEVVGVDDSGNPMVEIDGEIVAIRDDISIITEQDIQEEKASGEIPGPPVSPEDERPIDPPGEEPVEGEAVSPVDEKTNLEIIDLVGGNVRNIKEAVLDKIASSKDGMKDPKVRRWVQHVYDLEVARGDAARDSLVGDDGVLRKKLNPKTPGLKAGRTFRERSHSAYNEHTIERRMSEEEEGGGLKLRYQKGGKKYMEDDVRLLHQNSAETNTTDFTDPMFRKGNTGGKTIDQWLDVLINEGIIAPGTDLPGLVAKLVDRPHGSKGVPSLTQPVQEVEDMGSKEDKKIQLEISKLWAGTRSAESDLDYGSVISQLKKILKLLEGKSDKDKNGILFGWDAQREDVESDIEDHEISKSIQDQESEIKDAPDYKEPSTAQLEAGNYKKPHVSVRGLKISIENAVGNFREAIDKSWKNIMAASYGQILGDYPGADKDPMDVFLGPKPINGKIFIIDQLNQENGEFDEHKVMMGFETEDQAREAYLGSYKTGWVVKDITEVDETELKRWLDSNSKDDAKTEPYAPSFEFKDHPVEVGEVIEWTITDPEGKRNTYSGTVLAWDEDADKPVVDIGGDFPFVLQSKWKKKEPEKQTTRLPEENLEGEEKTREDRFREQLRRKKIEARDKAEAKEKKVLKPKVVEAAKFIAAAETGKPFEANVFRGKGKSKEEIYGEDKVEQGAAVPIMGSAGYYALDRKGAESYADPKTNVTEVRVRLENPLVINSDALWKRLLEGLGIYRELSSDPGADISTPEETVKATRTLQAALKKMNYDGVIIDVPGDVDISRSSKEKIKRLRESFDISQVIVFNDKTREVETKVEGTLPKEEARRIEQDVNAAAEGESKVDKEFQEILDLTSEPPVAPDDIRERAKEQYKGWKGKPTPQVPPIEGVTPLGAKPTEKKKFKAKSEKGKAALDILKKQGGAEGMPEVLGMGVPTPDFYELEEDVQYALIDLGVDLLEQGATGEEWADAMRELSGDWVEPYLDKALENSTEALAGEQEVERGKEEGDRKPTEDDSGREPDREGQDKEDGSVPGDGESRVQPPDREGGDGVLGPRDGLDRGTFRGFRAIRSESGKWFIDLDAIPELEPTHIVSKETADAIIGESTGSQRELYELQVRDIAMHVSAYLRGEGGSLLAWPAGTGKTFVQWGIIQELRKIGRPTATLQTKVDWAGDVGFPEGTRFSVVTEGKADIERLMKADVAVEQPSGKDIYLRVIESDRQGVAEYRDVSIEELPISAWVTITSKEAEEVFGPEFKSSVGKGQENNPLKKFLVVVERNELATQWINDVKGEGLEGVDFITYNGVSWKKKAYRQVKYPNDGPNKKLQGKQVSTDMLPTGHRDYTPNPVQLTRSVEFRADGKKKSRVDVDRSTGYPKLSEYDFISFDESQSLKNPESHRSQGAFVAMEKTKYVLFSSATPFERPKDMEYVTKVVDLLKGKTFPEWVEKYGEKEAKVDTVFDEPTQSWIDVVRYRWNHDVNDLLELNADLKSRGIMTTIKRQLPLDDQGRSMVSSKFILAPKDQELEDLYVDVLSRLDTLRDKLRNEGVHQKILMAIGGMRSMYARRILEAMKLRALLPEISKQLDEGRSIAVFSAYRSDKSIGKGEYVSGKRVRNMVESALEGLNYDLKSPQDVLREEFGNDPRVFPGEWVKTDSGQMVKNPGYKKPPFEFRGGISSSLVEKAKNAFNSGELRLIFVTNDKGGTGLSLHDKIGGFPRTQINLTLPWAARQVEQVSWRTARDGMKSDVRILWAFRPSAEEKRMAAMIANKMESMGALVGGQFEKPNVEDLLNFEMSMLDEKGRLKRDVGEDGPEDGDGGEFGNTGSVGMPDQSGLFGEEADNIDTQAQAAKLTDLESQLKELQSAKPDPNTPQGRKAIREYGRREARIRADIADIKRSQAAQAQGGFNFAKPKDGEAPNVAEEGSKESEGDVPEYRDSESLEEFSSRYEQWVKGLQPAREKFKEENGEVGFQAPLKKGKLKEHYVIVSQSAKRPGRWQASYFDEHGPYADIVRDSWDGLVEEIQTDRRVDMSQATTGEFEDKKPGASEWTREEEESGEQSAEEIRNDQDFDALSMPGAVPIEAQIEAPDPGGYLPPKNLAALETSRDAPTEPREEYKGKEPVIVTDIISTFEDIIKAAGRTLVLAKKGFFKHAGDQSELDAARQEIDDLEAKRHKYEPMSPESLKIRDRIEEIRSKFKTVEKKVPILTGRVSTSWAAGYFMIWPNVIRVRKWGDLETAAHEVAHALEKAIYGWVSGSPWRSRSQAQQNELHRAGKDLYQKRKPAGGYMREGWAEFIRNYIIYGKVKAEDKFPITFDWFENKFLKENTHIKDAIEKSSELANQYYGQGSIARVTAFVKWGKRRRQKLRDIFDSQKFYKQWFEEAATLELFTKLAEAEMKRPLRISENPFLTYSALRNTAGARSYYMVFEAMIDIKGNPTGGGSLMEAVDLVGDRRKDFTLYLIGRRAIERIRRGKEPGISLEDAKFLKHTFGTIQNPEYDPNDPESEERIPNQNFIDAAEKVYDWNYGVMNYALQSGLLPREAFDRIMEGSTDYIPYARIFDEVDPEFTKRMGEMGLKTNPYKLFEGDTRRIKDPFEVMVQQAEFVINKSHQRMVFNTLLKLVPHGNLRNTPGAPDLGYFINEVPREKIKKISSVGQGNIVVTIPSEMIKDKKISLKSALDAVLEKMQDEGDIQKSGKLEKEDIQAFIEFFIPADTPKGQDPILPMVDEKGEMRWFYVKEDFYNELMDMINPGHLPAWLEWVATPAKWFKMGTTGLRPAFALIRNPSRDLQSFFFQTQSNKNPVELAKLWTYAMSSSISDAVKGHRLKPGERDVFLEAGKRLGGVVMQPYGVDVDYGSRAVRSLFRGRQMGGVVTNAIDALARGLESYQTFLQVPELATRSAEIRARADEVGWDPSQPMTMDQSLQLLLDYKRVSIDFSSMGSLGKNVNRAIPFFNPAMQGLRQFARTAQTKPLRFLGRGAMVTAATLALWWTMKDEEWYRDMPWWERYTFWNVPIGNTVVRIPKAFEYGNAFAVIPEALFDAAYNKDPQSITAAIGHIFQTTIPDAFSQPLLGVTLEQLQNEEFFTGRPIIPSYQINLPPGEQVGPYTSWLAKMIADSFNFVIEDPLESITGYRSFSDLTEYAAPLDMLRSPRRIDHAIRGFFGGLGPDILRTIESLAGEGVLVGTAIDVATGEQEASRLPIVGSVFRPGAQEGFGSKSGDKLYREKEYLRTDYESARAKDEKLGEEADLYRKLITDATDAVSILSYLERYASSPEIRSRLQRHQREIAQSALSMKGETTEKKREKFQERIKEFKLEEMDLIGSAPHKPSQQITDKQVKVAQREHFNRGRLNFKVPGKSAPGPDDIRARREEAARDFLYARKHMSITGTRRDKAVRALAQEVRRKYGYVNP